MCRQKPIPSIVRLQILNATLDANTRYARDWFSDTQLRKMEAEATEIEASLGEQDRCLQCGAPLHSDIVDLTQPRPVDSMDRALYDVWGI